VTVYRYVSVSQMSDRKVLDVSGPDSKLTTPVAREAATEAALSGVLLPELTRIACVYDRRHAHRFDAETAPTKVLTVSADGRSFETFAPAEASSPKSPFVVWSRYTLRDGAQRWSVHLPAGCMCWIGVADVSTRTPQAYAAAPSRDSRDPPESVYAGHWCVNRVNVWSSIKSAAISRDGRACGFIRASRAFESQPTVVQCTFDEEAHTLDGDRR
jgi:hypothetical protein